MADEESDIKNIFKINFPDSLDVNAAVKESRNPGSILPLNRNQSIIIWCIINYVRDIRNLHPPTHTYIHLIRNPLDPSIYFEMSYIPLRGVTQPQGGRFIGGGGVTQPQLRLGDTLFSELFL